MKQNGQTIHAMSRDVFQLTKPKIHSWREDQIINKITKLDSINQKLLTIAQALSKTTFMNSKNTPAIIVQLEKELRAIISDLISNIKEFFVDIDNKLKLVLQSYQQQMAQNEHSRIIRPIIRPQQNQKLDHLATKVEGLQVSLRKTQANEQKLMQVITNLMEKYRIQDQPTIIRQDPQLQNQFNKFHESKRQSNIQSNYKTSNVQPVSDNHFRNRFQLYEIQESQVSEDQYDDDQHQYIRRLYSKNPKYTNRQNNFMSKKSLRSSTTSLDLKVDRGYVVGAGDKNHRLKFLMKKLKDEVK